MKKFILFTFLLLSTSFSTIAQVQFRYSFKRISKTEVDLIITGTIEPNWRIYSTKLPSDGPESAGIKLKYIEGAELMGDLKPSSNVKYAFDELFEQNLHFFENNCTFTQRIKLTSKNYTIKGSFIYSAVSSDFKCPPPAFVDFELKGSNGPTTPQKKTTGPTTPQKKTTEPTTPQKKTTEPSSENLLYEGDYTMSNSAYSTIYDQSTDAVGNGHKIHVKVYNDYIIINGLRYDYSSTSSEWRIYKGVTNYNSTDYYKVNFKNFEMSMYTTTYNQFTGLFDTYTRAIVKGKVDFNINNRNSNNNTNNYRTSPDSNGNTKKNTNRYTDKTCHGCHGSGKCKNCNGKGWFERLGVKGTMDCPNCTNGKCSICGGTGTIRGLK